MKLLFLYTNAKGVTKYMSEQHIAEHYADYQVTAIDLTKELKSEYVHANNLETYYQDSKKWIDLILAHDVIVISTSMYNFFPNPASINFLNKVVVAHVTFKYDENGKLVNPFAKEMAEKKLLVIASSGSKQSQLPPSVQNMFQAYTDAFTFIGLKNNRLIYVDGSNTPELYGKSHEEVYEYNKNKFV